MHQTASWPDTGRTLDIKHSVKSALTALADCVSIKHREVGGRGVGEESGLTPVITVIGRALRNAVEVSETGAWGSGA